MRTLLFSWMLSLLALGTQAQIAGVEKPNVIFLVVDDLNDYVGFLGGHPQTLTPNLDKLANRGTSFTNAYCTIPQCTPSRMSMLTGKRGEYIDVHLGGDFDNSDFRSNFDTLPVFTIPEVLKDSGGYYTLIANKIFHPRNDLPGVGDIDFDSLSSDPCNRGKSWSDITDLRTGPKLPQPDEGDLQGMEGLNWGPYNDSLERTHIDVRGIDSALQFLKEYFRFPEDYCDRPFFLAVGLTKPHQPLFFPRRWTSEYYNQDLYSVPYELPYNVPFNLDPPNGVVMPPQPPEGNWTDYDELPYLGKIIATDYGGQLHDQFLLYGDTLNPLPQIAPGLDSMERRDASVEAYRANAVLAYLSMIRFMDNQVGRLMEALETRPEIFHNTVVVLVSDHGFSLGQKKHWKKVALWETDLRIPMIIADPRRTSARECDKPVSLLDLFPTLLDLTGTPHPETTEGGDYLDGKSLVPLLDNPDLTWHLPVVSSVRMPFFSPDGGCFPHYSVRDERYHYIRYATNSASDSSATCHRDSIRFQEELYEIGENRDVDPNEWNNLASDPSYRKQMDYLEQWIPGGPLAGQFGGRIEIKHDTLPCVLDPQDSSFFWVDITDENGLLLDPGAYDIFWFSEILYDTLAGSSFYYDTLTVDGSAVGMFDRMDLRVVAFDTATGVMLADRESYHTKSLLIPNASFDASVSGRTATVDNYTIDGWVNSLEWDFGDSYVVNEPVPGPHSYAFPGTYLIQHDIFYGNDERNLCFKRVKRSVTVDTAAFDSLCAGVEQIELDFATASQARLEWPRVFSARGYNLRFRESIGENSWIDGVSVNPEILLTILKTNTPYELQAQSVCDTLGTDTSEFSASFHFITEPCSPPRSVSIEDVTQNSAVVRWVPSQDEPIAENLIYRAAAGGPLSFNTIVTGDSFHISGLDTATAYFFKMRSICPTTDGSLSIPGALSQLYGFTTLDTAGLRRSVPLEFEVFPNPTSDLFELRRSGKLGLNTVLVTDAAGRRMGTWRWPSGEISLRLDAADWPEGIYLISGEGLDPVSLTVIR